MITTEVHIPDLVSVLKLSPDIQIDLLKKFVKHTNQCPQNSDGSLNAEDLLSVREEMLNDILLKVEELLKTDACSIFIKDTASQAILRAARGYQIPKIGKAVRKIVSSTSVADKPTEREKLGLTSWVISTGRSFLATKREDFVNHPHWNGKLDEHLGEKLYEQKRPTSALLIIPLRDSRGQVIGALKAQRFIPNDFFSVENQITLEALGQITGRCITYVDDAQTGPVNAASTSWALKIFSDASTAEGELDSFLDIVVRVVAAASQADACSVFLIDESKRTLTQRAGSGHQNLKNTIRSYILPDRTTLDDCHIFEACNPATCLKKSIHGLPEDEKVGITAWVAATEKSFYANSKDELRQHCHHKGQFDKENFNKTNETLSKDSFLEECSAWFGVPLIVGGATIGVLKIENKTPIQVVDTRQFSPEVKQQLEILSQDLAISIRKLQIQGTTRYEVINKAMPTILTILQGDLGVSALVKSVMRETQNLFNARACVLFLKEGNQLIQPEWAAVGYASQTGSHPGAGYTIRKYDLVPVEVIDENPNPSKDEKEKKVGLTVWIAVKKQKFSARSNQELILHPHHKGTYDDKNFRDQEKCESFMGVPLLVGEQRELIGVLKVETKQKINGDRVDYSYFNEQDSLVFDLIANSVAIAIQNARLLAARRLADRLVEQSNRYNTLKEVFTFIDDRVDVINTLEGAVRNVAERDDKKARMIDRVTGILRPDFNVAVLEQLASSIRDSKDRYCIALTSIFELMARMMQVKSLPEIYQINPADDNTTRTIYDPTLALYDCAKKILDVHQVISEHLRQYARERYHIVELKSSLNLLETEIQDALNLTLFKQNIIVRIFSHWKELILMELSKQREVPNPYRAGVPLDATSTVFVGREEIFQWIDDSLHGQKVVLILHGGWHTGKTSILKQLQAGPFGEHVRDRNSAVPVFIDLQGIPDSTTELFLLNLSDKIYRAVGSSEIPNPDTLQEAFEKQAYRTFSRFLENVTDILQKQGRKYLILMLDEFELLDKRVRSGKLDPEIFNYLRSQMQHHGSLSFILAGRHTLEEMTPEFRNIIFNVGYHKEVGFLNDDEAERLITDPVKPFAVSYEKECVARILKLTAGHPYFIQQLCQRSIELLNKRKKGYVVTMDILKQAIDDSLKYDQVLELLWSAELSDTDRRLFETMTDLLCQDDEWVSETELLEKSELAPPELQQILQKPMIQKLVARRQETGSVAEYAFGVDMLRLWIKNAKTMPIH